MPSEVENARKGYNRRLRNIIPWRCPLIASKCKLRNDGSKREQYKSRQPYAFIARQYSSDCNDMEALAKRMLGQLARSFGYYVARNRSSEDENGSPTRKEIALIVAKDTAFVGHGFCNICALCMFSYFGVAELGHLNPNVLMEIGLMQAFGKPVVFTLDTRLTSLSKVPFDLSGSMIAIYDNGMDLRTRLRPLIEAVLEELKEESLI